jgi:hypothetical protein
VAAEKPKVQQENTVSSQDSSFYSKYIPQPVLTLMEEKLPHWQLINPSKWDSFWFKQYQKDSSLVNYVPADFDCDGKEDYALLLANPKGEAAVWVLQSVGTSYQPFKLQDVETSENPIDVGIELIPKGKLDYIDLDDENTKSMRLKCPAIQMLFFERGAVTYYWDKNKFKSVQTGD